MNLIHNLHNTYMANKRDPIVILRIDGEDLQEFVNSLTYEPEMLFVFSQIESCDQSLRDYITKALQILSVDQGMPPSTDSWVASNIVEPALLFSAINEQNEKPVSQQTFFNQLKKVAQVIAQRLKDQPVIVAHTENTFDGTQLNTLLSNKFELDKTLNAALETVPKDHSGKVSKEHLRVALNFVGPSAGLPPLGVVHEMDNLIADVLKTIDANDGILVGEEDFKRLLTEILGSIMTELQGIPITISSNSVVHELLTPSSSTPLHQS